MKSETIPCPICEGADTEDVSSCDLCRGSGSVEAAVIVDDGELYTWSVCDRSYALAATGSVVADSPGAALSFVCTHADKLVPAGARQDRCRVRITRESTGRVCGNWQVDLDAEQARRTA